MLTGNADVREAETMSEHGIRSVEMGASYIEIVCECGWRITYFGLDKRGVFSVLDQHRFRARTTEGDDVRLSFGCGADSWYYEEGARDGDTQDRSRPQFTRSPRYRRAFHLDD